LMIINWSKCHQSKALRHLDLKAKLKTLLSNVKEVLVKQAVTRLYLQSVKAETKITISSKA
jgi:hypothetical protein